MACLDYIEVSQRTLLFIDCSQPVTRVELLILNSWGVCGWSIFSKIRASSDEDASDGNNVSKFDHIKVYLPEIPKTVQNV